MTERSWRVAPAVLSGPTTMKRIHRSGSDRCRRRLDVARPRRPGHGHDQDLRPERKDPHPPGRNDILPAAELQGSGSQGRRKRARHLGHAGWQAYGQRGRHSVAADTVGAVRTGEPSAASIRVKVTTEQPSALLVATPRSQRAERYDNAAQTHSRHCDTGRHDRARSGCFRGPSRASGRMLPGPFCRMPDRNPCYVAERKAGPSEAQLGGIYRTEAQAQAAIAGIAACDPSMTRPSDASDSSMRG